MKYSENKAIILDRLKSNNFDFLRLFFAIMVILFHIGILSQCSSLDFLTKYISATFAVQAFFFISGFLIFMSCERSSSMVSYFKKRMFRIFPAYFTVVLCSSILLVFLSKLSFVEYFTSTQWKSYLINNLLLANFSSPTLPGVFESNSEATVNGSLWTIKIEVAFYCLVPFIVWLIQRYGYKRILIAIFLLSIFWKCAFIALSVYSNNEIYFKLSKQLPGQLSFFVGGAFAYYRTKKGLQAPSLWMVALCLLSYALSTSIVYEIISPFCVSIIVYWLAIQMPLISYNNKNGDYSYGLYLFHFPIVQTLISFGLLYYINAKLFAIICLSISLIVAVISWRFVEKPSLKYAHRK